MLNPSLFRERALQQTALQQTPMRPIKYQLELVRFLNILIPPIAPWCDVQMKVNIKIIYIIPQIITPLTQSFVLQSEFQV